MQTYWVSSVFRRAFIAAMGLATIFVVFDGKPALTQQVSGNHNSKPASLPAKTIVEQSQPLPPPPPGILGSGHYKPTDLEQPFFLKLAPEDQKQAKWTGPHIAVGAPITGRKGNYVSWFGIVRKINRENGGKITDLLIENKYFDGTSDTHIMTVSFNGAGDFTAIVNSPNPAIKDLSLVRVYGTVEDETNGIPTVAASYIRQWDWGLFNFMTYADQSGNDSWKKYSNVKSVPIGTGRDPIYHPFPDKQYYRDRLMAGFQDWKR